MMMLCITIMAGLPACSDDKEKDEPTPADAAAKSIAGVYSGDMSCTVMSSEETIPDVTFTVTATDGNTVSVTLPGFGNPPMQVPSVTVTGVKVSGSDGSYQLAASEFSGKTEAGKSYSGTIQGNFADNRITIKFNLQYGAMPVPMICSFTAPKK